MCPCNKYVVGGVLVLVAAALGLYFSPYGKDVKSKVEEAIHAGDSDVEKLADKSSESSKEEEGSEAEQEAKESAENAAEASKAEAVVSKK